MSPRAERLQRRLEIPLLVLAFSLGQFNRAFGKRELDDPAVAPNKMSERQWLSTRDDVRKAGSS